MKSFSRPRVELGVFPLATVLFCLLALPSVAAAALTGPVYPVPGGPDAGHGGNVCAATNTTEGVAGGITWTFGGGTPTAPSTCPVSATTPQPFDTNRFAALYWGSRSGARPKVAMDGAADSVVETLSFSSVLSNLPQGEVVWTGSTTLNGCKPDCGDFTPHAIQTRVKLTILAGAIGTARAALKTPTEAGIGDAQVGGVVSVTPALTNFRARIEVLASDDGGATFQPAQDLFNSYHTAGGGLLMSFTGAFWYQNRAPAADFTFDHLNPDSPITFTATYSDADGSVASSDIAWDFNDDGKFQESKAPTAQWSFPPGPHKVHFRAIDNEGTATVATKTLVIKPYPDTDGDGYVPPADCAPTNPAINPGAAEIHDNGVDENCNGNGDDPDLDRDHDGFPRPADCADDNAAIHPGAVDVPDNGIDENCDGTDAKLEQVQVTVSYTYKASKKSTKLTSLQAKVVPAGSTVTVTCKPKKKCGKTARKKFTKRNASGTVKLKKFVTTFKVGAVIEVRVTHPGMKGVVKRIKIRKSKAPIISTLCLNPGATKPTSCI